MFWKAFKKEMKKIAEEISESYELSKKEKEVARKYVRQNFPETCLETPENIRKHRRALNAYMRKYRRRLADQRRPKAARALTDLPLKSLKEQIKLRASNTKARNRTRKPLILDNS